LNLLEVLRTLCPLYHRRVNFLVLSPEDEPRWRIKPHCMLARLDLETTTVIVTTEIRLATMLYVNGHESAAYGIRKGIRLLYPPPIWAAVTVGGKLGLYAVGFWENGGVQ
jgi:hypothetical protein